MIIQHGSPPKRNGLLSINTNIYKLKKCTAFDKEPCRDRNIVERLIGWLKEYRRIFSCYEKTAKNFLGMIRMAFIQRYLRTKTGTG